MAEKSRGMHKTQGFDTWKIAGAENGPRMESFQLLDGSPATSDILEGVDSSWNRIPGGADVSKSIDEIIATFNQKDVPASVPALLKLRKKLAGLAASDPIVKDKQAQLDRILQECVGLEAQTTIKQHDVVPGEPMSLHHTAVVHSNIPVRWVAVRYPETNREVQKGLELRNNETATLDEVETLPSTTPLTQPWWLRIDGTPGMFSTNDPTLIGTPENAPSFPIEEIFEVAGDRIVVHDEPVQVSTTTSGKQITRRVNVIPPVSLRFSSDVALFTPNSSHPVQVEITASRADSSGTLRLNMPSGWKVLPAAQSFHLTAVGQHEQFKFTITAPSQLATVKIIADADIHGTHYCNQRDEIDYPHIPPQLLQPPAALRAVSLDLVTDARLVGYIPGAGDSLPENLQQMGCTVKVLDDATLTAEQLVGLDAVVIGVRAANVRKNLDAAMPLLFDYVKNGGTVIEQYNRADGLKATKLAPYDLHLSADRVTDEAAAVTFLAPENPVLNTPNKISKADFDGWVQERGLYFPNQWDDHFTPIIACGDPGEAQLKGSLLVANYGEGHFIYTGLSFFRQLPAGVPGAYRLFANMLSISHETH